MNNQNVSTDMKKFCLVFPESGSDGKEFFAKNWEEAREWARSEISSYWAGNQTDEYAEDLVVDCTIQELEIDGDGDDSIAQEERGEFLVERGDLYRPKCIEGQKHKWTREGFGGCRENPGIWSQGTNIIHLRRCVLCALVEREIFSTQNGLSAFAWSYNHDEE